MKQVVIALTASYLCAASCTWAAADGATQGSTVYGGGGAEVDFFKAMQDGSGKYMHGDSYVKSTTIGLAAEFGNANLNISLGNYADPGGALAIGSTRNKWSNVMAQGNTAYGKMYSQIVCVVPTVGGAAREIAITAANWSSKSTFDAIVAAVNDYAADPEVAKKVMAAYAEGNIESAIAIILPEFYFADASGNYDTGDRVMISSIQLGAIDVKQEGANIRPPKPADDSVKSYDKKVVAAGGKWRPLDRMESVGEDGYITGGKWILPARWEVLSYGGDGAPVVEEETRRPLWGDADRYPAGGQNAKGGEVWTGSSLLTVGELIVGAGGTVDLSYANTAGALIDDRPAVSYWQEREDSAGGGTHAGGYVAYPTGYFEEVPYNGALLVKPILRSPERTLYVDKATLAEGAAFRLGSYGWEGSTKSDNDNAYVAFIDSNRQDQVMIREALPDAPTGGKTKLYIELGWVPGVGTEISGAARNVDGSGIVRDTVMIGMLKGGESFEVEGRTSLSDGIFSLYEITPVIGRRDNYFNVSGDKDDFTHQLKQETGTAWYLESYTYRNTGLIGESGRSAAENAGVMSNLWKGNYTNLFRRIGDLHRGAAVQNEGAALRPDELRESAWGEMWHGRYDSAAAYGRVVGQTYDGIQAGYDKLLAKPYFGGRLYAGGYLMKTEGKSRTATGDGEQESLGGGVYGTWIGAKGHFFDAALLAARLEDDYRFQGPILPGVSDMVAGSVNAWAYGLGARYGYRRAFGGGWFAEPSVMAFAGHRDAHSYVLSNGLGIDMDGADTLTGRVSLRFGRSLGAAGSFYGGVAAGHEFAGAAPVRQFMAGMSERLETVGGKDSWYELSLGGNVRISPTGWLDLSYNKTFGADAGDDWNVRGMFSWSWGPAGVKEAERPAASADGRADAFAETALAAGGEMTAAASEKPTAASVKVSEKQKAALSAAREESDESQHPVTDIGSREEAEEPKAAPKLGGEALLAYEFDDKTVERARPAWEKSLSPGQVSVVYPSEFEGEQKSLPDLLQRVPGLFVQRTNGSGHYTVARVRGSTGAQVNVYVDGVLMNLNGDAAVDLSSIPVDNVERVEVYRGYVPARFAGAPLGGVINIVTKKPREAGGRVTQGVKSYGGYTGTYEYSAPLAGGSLLATYQHDGWDGDYDFLAGRGKPFATDVGRRSNGYQNGNGMLKWQDDHWAVKAAWKKQREELPMNVGGINPNPALIGNPAAYTVEEYLSGLYDRRQSIDQKEFQIGRRAASGNLDWGWRVAYVDSRKEYRNTGAMADEYLSQWLPEGHFDADLGGGYFWADYASKKWSGNLNGAYKMGGAHLLEFNFDFSREKMNANGDHWDDYDEGYGLSLGGRKYIRRYGINEYHLTVQDTMALNDGGDFKFTPIFRADKVEMDTMAENDQRWKYSAGAALEKQIDSHWGLKASWGTYNRHPNFYELFGDGAYMRPTLGGWGTGPHGFYDIGGEGTWERGRQFDFSLSWRGKLSAAETDTVLTWFKRSADRQYILFMPMIPHVPSTYYPISDVDVRGLELSHTMRWDRLILTTAGTWQKAEYGDTAFNGSMGAKNVVTMTPEWIWSARLDYRFPGDKLSAFVEYSYTGEQSVDGGYQRSGDLGGSPKEYGRWLSALTTLDLGFKYAFDDRWKLDLGVNDVFSKGYGQGVSNRFKGIYDHFGTAYYPLPGRVYYATLECRF